MSTTARTASGDLVLPRQIVTDFASCVRQAIIDGLSLWLGEWFLDTSVGFPWAQRIFGIKNPNQTQLQALFRQFLLSIAGVVAVVASVTINRPARQFSYSFVATLNNGQTITGGSGQPFTISGAP